MEAVRAGHRTTHAIMDALNLSYAAANRRVNELLELGLLRIDRSTPSRPRHLTLRDPS